MRYSQLIFFIFPFFCWAELETSTEYELGYQSAFNFDIGKPTLNRPYLFVKMQMQKELERNSGTIFSLDLAARAWVDFEEDQESLDLRALAANWNSDYWSLKIGKQEIPWGETFGFFILDLVNPRDLSDPLLNDLSWTRKPVAACNLQLYRRSLTLQFILTPLPRKHRLPQRGSHFDLIPSSIHLLPQKDFRIGTDMEYGARLGYLFDCGLDLNLYYLRHWNRNLVFSFEIVNAQASFLLPQRRVQSFGLSASYALEEIVLRLDSVFHEKTPWQGISLGSVQYTGVWRSIVGADLTKESGWTYDIQIHHDHWKQEDLIWISGNVRKDFLDNKVEAEAFLFLGINNPDFWLQPKVTWNFHSKWKASLRGDFLSARHSGKTLQDGILSPLRRQDRLFLWITYKT